MSFAYSKGGNVNEALRGAAFFGKWNLKPASNIVRLQGRTEQGHEAAGWKPRKPK